MEDLFDIDWMFISPNDIFVPSPSGNFEYREIMHGSIIENFLHKRGSMRVAHGSDK